MTLETFFCLLKQSLVRYGLCLKNYVSETLQRLSATFSYIVTKSALWQDHVQESYTA